MNLVSDSGAYALLFAFGAIAVAVQAYGLYATSLAPAGDERTVSVLENIALPHLGGPRAYNRGFLCYLAIVECLYVVLSSSSVILELSLSVLESNGTIGALTLDEGEFNPMTPLLASSAIMTLGQIRPFAQIENAIRRIAHRVAGIPDGLYETVGRLDSFPVDAVENTDAAPSPAVTEARELAERVRSAALAAGLGATEAKALAERVRWIYGLRAWTVGVEGERLWNRQSVVALRSAFALVRSGFAAFDEKLRHELKRAGETTGPGRAGFPDDASTTASGDGSAPDGWKTLSSEARDTKDDLSILFALLMVNQPQVRSSETDGAGWVLRLMQHMRQRDETREINVLLVASIGGLFAGSCLALLYYLAEPPLGNALTQAGALLDDLPARARSLLASTEAGESVAALAGGDARPALLTAVTDEGIDPPSRLLMQRLQSGLARTGDNVVPLGLVFAVSTLVALSIRADRESALRWTYWSAGGYPVRQYLIVSLLATLIAFLVYLLYSFYSMVLQPSFAIERTLMSPSLLRDFAGQFSGFVLVPLVGAICAWAVCFLSDRQIDPADTGRRFGRPATRALPHADVAWWSFRFAAFCGLLNAAIRVENGSVVTLARAFEALLVPALVLGPCFYLYATLYGGRPDKGEDRSDGSSGEGEDADGGALDAR